MNLILNPIEKELRVRRQKIKIKTGEEEHAEEVLRTCFKENVCYGGEKWANNPLNLSLGQNQRSGPKSSPEGWSPAARFSQAAPRTSFHPQGWKTPDLL